MKLCCPACGFMSAIEVFASDKAARRFAALMGRVPPPLSELVLRYLGLFAPAKHAMTFAKGERFLADLVGMIEAGQITRARRSWPVSLAQFEAGLQAMCDKRPSLTLPLKSHGYLLEVLAGAADKLEARAEAEQIADDRSGRARQAETAALASEAAQWDAQRRGEADKARAIQALVQERAGLQRLQIEPTDKALREVLLKQGHPLQAIDFALSKLPEGLP